MRERFAVNGCRGRHRELDPGVGQRAQLLREPLGIAHRDVGDAVETAPAFGHDPGHPAVERAHVAGQRREIVRERLFPQEPEVREHDGSVEAEVVECSDACLRVGVLGRKELVVARLGRLARFHAEPFLADQRRLAGHLDLRGIEARAAPGEPRVTQLVVFDRERGVAQRRIDVVAPHRPRLVQMLISVDDPRSHRTLPIMRARRSLLPWRPTHHPVSSPRDRAGRGRLRASRQPCRRRSRCSHPGRGRRPSPRNGS